MDIKDIDFSRKYTGYLWLSNAAKPIALTEPGIVDKSLFEKKNPFVAEAQLYDSEGDVSVSIRYADGRYYAAIHKAASITGDSTMRASGWRHPSSRARFLSDSHL